MNVITNIIDTDLLYLNKFDLQQISLVRYTYRRSTFLLDFSTGREGGGCGSIPLSVCEIIFKIYTIIVYLPIQHSSLRNE